MKSYKEAKTGDIITRHVPFCWYKPNRYISAFIRFFTKSWASHTAIFIDVWGEKMVLENDNSKTRLISFSNWAKDSFIVVSRDNSLTKIDKRLICVLAISELGNTGYDYESIPAHIFYSICGVWIGRTGENSKGKKVCSELIAFLYYQVKGYYKSWWKVTPKVIYEDDNFEVIYNGEAKKIIN